jgi:Uma2 family endonuclease
VIVLCGEAPERHVETTPALVAEILSPSTAERDRTFKRDLYDEQNVNVYLIIDPVEKTLLAHRRDDAGCWRSESVIDEIEVVVCDDCSATIRLENLF